MRLTHEEIVTRENARKRAEEIRRKEAKMVAKSATRLGQTKRQWQNSEYVRPQRTKVA